MSATTATRDHPGQEVARGGDKLDDRDRDRDGGGGDGDRDTVRPAAR